MIWKGAIAAAIGFAVLFAVFVYERERAKREPKVVEVAKEEQVKDIPAEHAEPPKAVKLPVPNEAVKEPEPFKGPVEIDSGKSVSYKNVWGRIHTSPRRVFYLLTFDREEGTRINFWASVNEGEVLEEFWIDVSIAENLADQIKTNHIEFQVDGFKIRDMTPEPGVSSLDDGRIIVASSFPIEEIWRLTFFDRVRVTSGQKKFNATKEEVEDIKDFARIVQKCISHRPGTPFPLE